MKFIDKCKSGLLRLVDTTHRFLFGYGLHSAAIDFFHDLSWSFFGGAISGFILLITNILVGRIFGPTEFGKINIIVAISQIAIVFVLFGMDRVSMRAIAMQKTKEQKAGHISTALYFIILTSGIFIILCLITYNYLSAIIGIEKTLIIMGLVYGLILSFQQLMNGFIRGLEKFRYQAITKIIQSTLVLFIFFLLWKFSHSVNYTTYIFIIILIGLLFIFLYLYKIRSYFTSFNKKFFKEQFSFASLFFIAAIFSILFGSLDKFLLSKYLGFHELGIYSAYFAASVGLISQINTLFSNVFFTVVSKNLEHLPSIVKKIDKLSIIGLIPMFMITEGLVFIVIKLFGSSYQFNWLYASLFSLLAVLVTIFSINASIVQAHSKKAFKKTFYLGNISSLFFVVVYYIVIRFIGLSISWVVLILIGSYTVSIVICKYALYRGGIYKSIS